MLGGLVDFGVASLVLAGLMVWYRVPPTLNIVWLPAFLLLAMATALGCGLWLGALNVRYRDVNCLMQIRMMCHDSWEFRDNDRYGNLSPI